MAAPANKRGPGKVTPKAQTRLKSAVVKGAVKGARKQQRQVSGVKKA